MKAALYIGTIRMVCAEVDTSCAGKQRYSTNLFRNSTGTFKMENLVAAKGAGIGNANFGCYYKGNIVFGWSGGVVGYINASDLKPGETMDVGELSAEGQLREIPLDTCGPVIPDGTPHTGRTACTVKGDYGDAGSCVVLDDVLYTQFQHTIFKWESINPPKFTALGLQTYTGKVWRDPQLQDELISKVFPSRLDSKRMAFSSRSKRIFAGYRQVGETAPYPDAIIMYDANLNEISRYEYYSSTISGPAMAVSCTDEELFVVGGGEGKTTRVFTWDSDSLVLNRTFLDETNQFDPLITGRSRKVLALACPENLPNADNVDSPLTEPANFRRSNGENNVNWKGLVRSTGQLGGGLGASEAMMWHDGRIVLSQCLTAAAPTTSATETTTASSTTNTSTYTATTITATTSTATATPEATTRTTTTRTTKMRKWQYGCQKQEVYKSGTYYFLKSPGVSAKLSKEMNDAFDGNLHDAGTPCGGVS